MTVKKCFSLSAVAAACLLASLPAAAGSSAAAPATEQTAVQPQQGTPAQTPEPDFYYGVGAHFGMFRHSEKQLFSAIEQAGVNAVRDDVSWRAVEREGRGVYNTRYIDSVVARVLERGMVPMPILGYGNPFYGGSYPHDEASLEAYTKYCEFVVSRFKGRIPVYEIWNEWGATPDPKSGPSSAEDYARLLAYVIPRLRAIDPDAKFITGWRDEQSMPSRSGSYTAWINNFLEAGCLEHLDGYSSHPYGYRDMDRRYPEDLVQRMEALQELLKRYNGGREMPIYITELGWPTHTGKWGMQPAGQLDAVSRGYLVARTIPYVRGLWYYNMQDDGYSHEYNENNFGLLRPDGTPKPGYWGLAGTVNELRNLTYVGRKATQHEDVWLLQFRSADGQPVWAAWTSSRMNQYQIVLEAAAPVGDPSLAASPLTLTPVGRTPFTLPFGYREWVDARNNHTLRNEVQPNQVSLTLTPTPVFIRGPLESLEIAKIVVHEYPVSDSPENLGVRYPGAIAVSRHLETSAEAFWREALRSGQSLLGNWHAVSLPIPVPAEPEAVKLSARFACFNTADTLFVAVNVKDAVHHQQTGGDLAWMGDSLQIALQSHPAGYITGSDKTTSVCISLVDGRTDIYRHASETGLPRGPEDMIKANVVRSGGDTFYLVAVPAAAIGLKSFPANGHIGFSLLVNNNDGAGRTWLGWGGDGIIRGTNPDRYNWLVFSPDGVAAQPR